MWLGPVLLLAVLFALPPERAACLHLSGNVSTSFRAYEDTSYHFLSYQQARFKGTLSSVPGLTLQANVRWAADLQEDLSKTENTRLYNALVGWRSSGGGLGVDVGRRFIHMGVGNGTLDGLVLSLSPGSSARLSAYVGMEAPGSREAEIHEWSQANVYGLHLRGTGKTSSWEMSWVRKSRMENVYWHQAGVNLKTGLGRSLQTLLRVDYNAEASELQLFRAQGRYHYRSLRVWCEGSLQAPRIAEDSFFRIFDFERFSQVRVGARYGFPGRTALGVEFIETLYSEQAARRVRVLIEGGFITLGMQLRGGEAAGERTAFFGGLRYTLGPFRSRLDFDVTQYKLSSQDRITDQRALTAEIEWRVGGGPVVARLRAERLTNREYDPDYRGFGRLSLEF